MKKEFRSSTVIAACAACLLLGALIMLAAAVIMAGGPANFSYASKYLSVCELITDRYIGESDPDELCDAAMSAMVTATGDRWSYYMTAEEYESYKQYVANVYTGVGITISPSEDGEGFLIMSVTADSPAENAGIIAGDILTAVDGESVSGMTTAELKALIQSRGSEQMTFSLTRADGKASEVSVACGEISVQAVSYEMLEDSIGYVHIVNFESGSAEGAVNAVNELLQQGAKALVFDVRSNPGGLVSELTELLDFLLPEGDIFVSVNKAGEETVTRSDSACIELPMAVLVDSGSYSAAELFAATLSEYGWAKTVGEATTGKGRSQITVVLADGSAVHLSTNAYLTPNRIDLSVTGGIVPDYNVENTGDGDSQLETAIQILS